MGTQMPTPTQPQVVDYPVEIVPPDLGPWPAGSTGTAGVHGFTAERPGPHVVVSAIIHGNEPAGAVALTRLLERGVRPARGRLTLVFGNIDAYARFDPADPRASRWVDEDMNRVWSPDRLTGDSVERRRARTLLPIIAGADHLLDLHTTQHANEPLILAGPLERNRRLALAVGGADLVVIDEGHAQGARLRDHAQFGDPAGTATAMLVECGQHWAAGSAEVATAVTLRFLDHLGMLPRDFERGPVVSVPARPSRFVEVTHAVTIKRAFTFALPLRGGEVLPRAGTIIGHDDGEPVVTPYDDCVVVMPSQRLWAGLTAVRLGRAIAAPQAAAEAF